ncbi:hypothetical protein MRX96_057493 [Rhipicephalus microplus]
MNVSLVAGTPDGLYVRVARTLSTCACSAACCGQDVVRVLSAPPPTLDCRTAAYALTDSVRTRGVNPCSNFYQFCCGLWNVSQQGLVDGGNHSGTYQQWLEHRYVAHVNTRMLELLKSKNTDNDDRNDPSPRRVVQFHFDRELQDAIAEDEDSQDREADTVVSIWKHVRGQALDLWNVSTDALEPSDEDAPSLKEAYGPDFLSNLVLNTRLTGNQINISRGLASLPLTHGNFDAIHVRPDFMYPLAPEPSINYATMGVMIANMLIGAALQPSSRDAEDQEVED